jgi:steroid 5-alpha reductase family enzyme
VGNCTGAVEMDTVLYRIIQCTWGILQTLLGAVVYLCHKNNPHFSYHGAIVTQWKNTSSVSLGMFVFVTNEPYFYMNLQEAYSKEELSERLLVHEYGHTLQSLIFGPLYLFAMGIPSTLWGFLPSLVKMRHNMQVSYFSFFTESWANSLGEAATGKKSMESLVID